MKRIGHQNITQFFFSPSFIPIGLRVVRHKSQTAANNLLDVIQTNPFSENFDACDSIKLA